MSATFAPEDLGHGLDHDAMVVALGQAGDGDGPDDIRCRFSKMGTLPPCAA